MMHLSVNDYDCRSFPYMTGYCPDRSLEQPVSRTHWRDHVAREWLENQFLLSFICLFFVKANNGMQEQELRVIRQNYVENYHALDSNRLVRRRGPAL